MEMRRIPKASQVTAIVNSLTGDAWTVLNGTDIQLNDPNLSGFECLRQMEQYFYTPATRNRHKAIFKTMQQGNDPLEIWRSRLLKEARLAYPSLSNIQLRTYEPLLDRFLEGLRQTPVALEVRRHHPRSVDEAFDIASEESAVLLEHHRAKAYSQGTRGSVHTVGYQTNDADEQSAGGPRKGRGRGGRRGRGRGRGRGDRPNVNNLTNPGSSQWSNVKENNPDIRCYICDQKGHIQRNCPSRPNPGPRGRGRGRSRGRGGGYQERQQGVRNLKGEPETENRPDIPKTEGTESTDTHQPKN